MMTTYALWSDTNVKIEHFAGPCRLAKWKDIPEGWTVERFLGDTSQGIVTIDDVRQHASEIEVQREN